MRIERIELNGFKSFSEKTIFNFHPGVTAIVGPNGCGKSNIVDAFRWVLGEQSAKSLRGDTMEDVIFSGSASRKPKGMAEVSLVISGVNNGNVNQSAEVTVTRRLYRSGESEYLMNKVPCRLKDIKTVFLDTGLELKTYSILEQGKIDVILNSKPHERRFLIEEVAGVMKYNVRKAEALQKLESAQSNLQRLQDIVTEVKRQINSIERFAKRAEKYKALYEKIKSIEINISVRDADFLKRELDAVIDTENGLKNKETECSTHVHSADVLIEEKKLLCTDKEKVLEETQKKLNSAERDLLEEEGRISLLKSDCENLKERLKRLFARDSELSDEKENINAHADELERNSKDMEHEISGIEKILNSKNQLFLSLERELRDFDEKLDTERKNLFQKVEEFSTARNEIKNLSLMKENLENREKKSKSDLHNLKGELSQHAGTLKSAEKERHDLEKKLKEKDKVKELSSREINERREKLAAKEGSLYKDREELAAMVSRVESLKELDRGRMNVVDDKIKILCHIADIFEPLPEYETAIEAALGEKLNVAVVHDDQDVRRALQFIKEHKKDRSGFLSAKVFPISGNPPVSSSFSEQVIGKAIDFVKIKEGFGNIASLLLNDVMIVENLSTAFDIWKDTVKTSSQRSSPHYFVTVDGDVLEPSGVVYGGTEKNILQVKREIKELEQTILNKKNLIVSSEKEISSERESITSLESIIVSLNNEISAFEKSQHELEVKIAGTHEDKTRQQKKIEFFSLEIEQERKEKERIYSILDAKNETCKTWEKGKSSIENTMKGIQKELEVKKSSLEVLRSELTERRVSHTALKEKRDSIKREMEKLTASRINIDERKSGMSKERIEIEDNINQKKNKISASENSLKSFVIAIKKLQEESLQVKEILDAKTAELNLIEKQQKKNIEELSSVRKELAQVEVKRTELALNLTHLKEDMKKTYLIDLDNLDREHMLSETISPEEEESLSHLKEKLQGMGPVNLGTLEELEELKTRYDFLTKQQGDLLHAISSLQDTISRINNTTRSKLKHAFEALNEKFKEVFTILFGKGRAELILTEGSILEAGIDIVAQPPGKKLQNLMLLSGGEKALTAISLLFAGFMIKPTPLCLLDEVDAPLDESNTERFTSLLTELSRNIQFISITHNRRTMEVSDYIYGVTMEEPGVSKVVSMHMAEMV